MRSVFIKGSKESLAKTQLKFTNSISRINGENEEESEDANGEENGMPNQTKPAQSFSTKPLELLALIKHWWAPDDALEHRMAAHETAAGEPVS